MTDTLTPEEQAERARRNDERQQVARTIKQQITVGVMMSLGASDFFMTRSPGLTFKARIIPTGQSKPRVMDVRVELVRDLYDITVTYQAKGKRFDAPVVHFETSGVFGEDLARTLLALDSGA